jgi:hypothetical protein
MYRTVPTNDQILVPETLLKKRKSQEKARAERASEIEKKKKVRPHPTAAFRPLSPLPGHMMHKIPIN